MSESQFRVMVVDDERLSRLTTAKQLAAAGYKSSDAASGQEVLDRCAAGECWDLVLTDLRMPGMDGVELLRELKRCCPTTEVILMTAYGSVQDAVEAMRLGAIDFLTKPFVFGELELRIDRLRERKGERAELDVLRGLVGERFGMVGSSPCIERVAQRITTFAKSEAPVLVTGETGTGKEVVSRALHLASGRAGRFVAVGCGTIPAELAESEFFGHERGAFTGATSRRLGRFEEADDGTLLLDDVDDLPLDLQVKLLRVLQEGTLVRVGGRGEVEVDVRVVATTKVDLEKAVEAGSFRPDLFYRLRGLELRLDPLREREGDIPLLADHFLERLAAKTGQPRKRFSPGALQILCRYDWPGNVRELSRGVESAVVLSPADVIGPESLPDFLLQQGSKRGAFELNLGNAESIDMHELVVEFERRLLRWGLARGEGKQTAAARALGLPRTTLQSKLREHGVE